MWRFGVLFYCLVLCCASSEVFAQTSGLREFQLLIPQDSTVMLDSLTIYPNSFEVRCGEELLSRDQYELDFAGAQFTPNVTCGIPLTFKYRVLPMNLSKNYQLRDTSMIYDRPEDPQEKFMIRTRRVEDELFGGRGLNKSGSISRGVTFGNSQDLGVNSTLNLELSGQIAPNLKLLASVSDDNIPIQPDGNTNKLREFDQVFIQVYNDNFKMIAGDFWLYRPKSYFMSYKKRAQGLTIENYWQRDSTTQFKTQVSGALSRGKFNRQIIQGVEGNQGPYRLLGAENEPFIIILSGTERVYIDGKLLERGQEFDYVIDYNTAEVTFTSRQLISKDSRIVVEFQYSDQNYLRSLFQTSTTYSNDRYKFWFNAYSEQDAKNQTIQQELTLGQKELLSNIGDTLELARIRSVDSVGYLDNQNLYKMIDSLGYDSVLVYSVSPDSAFYRATFEFVGAGNGDYVFSNYNALGKVFKWVAPIAGVSQGDYAPSRLIVTPKQRQMVTGGMEVKLNEKNKLEVELAYTKNDLNKFSRFDSDDDNSVAGFFKYQGDIDLSRDSVPSWILRSKVEFEGLQRNFNPIEQYRAVEFDRDWNTRGKGFVGDQISSKLGADFRHRLFGNINVEGQQYMIGSDYSGLRAATDGKWKQRGFQAVWDGSYLSSQAENRNTFYRHRTDISQSIGWLKIGYKDDHERNEFSGDVLETSSYEFFDYQFYLANSDSIKNDYRIFFRERHDWRSDSTSLRHAARARSAGVELGFTEWKNQELKVVSSYRSLEILDSSLLAIQPENTILGRLEYNLRALRGALSLNTFYEVGSGLELKREFLYIQVNDGQGIYTWVDYNGDGVKDLNEFEIAQFADQASYIRVFIPSNEYVKTYSNEFNQSVYWRPERLWASKKGALKFLARFSDQLSVRIKRKTNYFNSTNGFNPFFTEIADTNLISTNSNIRNSLFFNRTSSIAGGEYIFQRVNAKNLLASGFDSRSNQFHEVVLRWNVKRFLTLKTKGKIGKKESSADYVSGRDFSLDVVSLEPSIIYQPNTRFRISMDARGSEKRNKPELGGELATVLEVGTSFKYNQIEKGSLQGEFKVLSIRYDGQQNSALGFEMLEALKPGVNYTWSLSYQRSISKNMQLTFQYSGRKPEDVRMIHSGGMELRAFF